MSFIIRAKCQSCYQESADMIIGEACHFIHICSSCENVVNPQATRFRFNNPNCPECGAVLNEAGQVDYHTLPMDYEGKTFSEHRCPRCKVGALVFQKIAHIENPIKMEVYPEKDAIVHGIVESKELKIPGLLLLFGKLILENLPEAPPNTPIVLKVIDVERRGDIVAKLRLRYIRCLNERSENDASAT